MEQDKIVSRATQKILLATAIAGASASVASLDLEDLAATAEANPINEPGWYAGANLGFFRGSGGEFDDNDNFIELLGGYKFNPFIAVEASYLNFGRFGGEIATADVDGWTIAAVGAYPLMENWNAYAKIGMLFSNVDVQMTDLSASDSDDQLFIGIGVRYTLLDPISLSLEYNRHRFNVDATEWPEDVGTSSVDMDTFKLGAQYHF